MAAKNDLIVRLLLDSAQFEGGIRNSSKELMQMRANISKGTDILDSFTGGLVKSATKFASWGAAAAAAGKVLSDVFMSAESNADDYHRMQTQATEAYNMFVRTIESGNWSNFFTNLQRAIDGAAELYDKLDRLGSIKTNNRAAIEIVRNRISEATRKLADKSLTAEERRALQSSMKQDQGELRAKMNEQVDAGKKAGFAQIMQSFQGYGLSNDEMRKATYNIINRGQKFDNEMDQVIKEWEAKANRTAVTMSGNWGAMTAMGGNNNMPALVKLAYAVKQGESAESRIAGLATYAEAVGYSTQAEREARMALRQANKSIGGAGGSNGGASSLREAAEVGSLNYINDTINALRRARGNTVDTTRQADIDAQIAELVSQRIRLNYGERKPEAIGGSVGEMPVLAGVPDLTDKIKPLIEANNELMIMRKNLTDDAMASAVYNLEDAFISFGDVLGRVGGKFIAFAANRDSQIADLVAQNAQLMASAQAASLAGAAKNAFQLPFPFNLAMWASMSATVLGIFASLPKFAGGGIFEGLESGDRNLARVNGGEMILNKAQQRRLFDIADGKVAAGGGAVSVGIEGDALVGVLNNYNKEQRIGL